MRVSLVVAAVLLAVSGCGSSSTVVEGRPVASPYDGPMSVPIDHSDEAGVLERSGAAGRALECAGSPYDGGGADYDSGLARTQSSPERALANLMAKDPPTYPPHDGYRVERRDGGRVLFSYDVEGRTKVALVAADDVRDWDGRTGWGIEAWAQCDPAELPDGAHGAFTLQVWTDAAGNRVPVTTIRSFRGPAHCDWQDITFVELGPESASVREEYLRDPQGELASWETTTFEAGAMLPPGAVDSGYRRDGRALWRVPDRRAAYLVDLDDPTDVERWPASTQPIGCD